MQPSTRFLSGLTTPQITSIQNRILEVIRAARPGSDNPEPVLARVRENLEATANDDTGRLLLERIASLRGEALALALHNIEHQRLSPEEKRRHRARKVTYYRQRQIEGMSSSWGW